MAGGTLGLFLTSGTSLGGSFHCWSIASSRQGLAQGPESGTGASRRLEMANTLKTKPGQGKLATMGWQPKLNKIIPAEGSRPRPWVLIAEEHAPAAVQLLLNIMNGNHPIKIRMEAAAKVLMIAGTGFRGEARDATGRPAANGTFRLAGNSTGPGANHELLRAALRTLPEGAVKQGPEQVAPGERVVLLNSSRQSGVRKNPEIHDGGVFQGKPEGTVYKPNSFTHAHREIVVEKEEQEDLEEEAGYF